MRRAGRAARLANGAALGFVSNAKMRKNADAARQISLLHEVGPLLLLFSTENNGYFPAAKHTKMRPDGGFDHNHWHQYLVNLMVPDQPLSTIKSENWRNTNHSFLVNPLWKKPPNSRTHKPWYAGYALNGGIATNLRTPWPPDATWYGEVPFLLSAVDNAARAPIVVPWDDYHYTTTNTNPSNISQFTVKGKLPILFVDGHVETIVPKEYEARKLHEMPK